jgi:glycosyltransferase involved in cell wall biosynthesis
MKILYFAPIDWDYIRQRPQHTAKQLSAFHSFYYIQPFGLRNLRVSDLSRVMKRFPGLFNKQRPQEDLHIVNLKFIPFIHRYIHKINVSLLKKQVEPLLDDETIIWITNPSKVMPDLINGLNYRAMVYELIDDNEEIHSAHKNDIMITERWLINRANLIIATSSKLCEKAKKINKNKEIVLVGNGVEYDFFNKDFFKKPKELQGMKKVVGYVGSIDSWMDFETIQFIADKREDLNFVFVGPLKVENLPSGKNIHFLGRKDYDNVPDYCYFFDACLIPFTVSEFADSINPVKLYEYLALGKPVIAYKMKELNPFGELLHLAEDKRDFLKKLESALAETDESLRLKRRELAKLNDWSEKARLIKDALAGLQNYD